MNAKPRILAIIPARGGSKRIIKKNLAKLGDQTLVSRAMQSAIDSGLFSQVILSSDDSEILAEANNFSDRITPVIREAELASDKASSVDVVSSLLAQFPGFDYVCLLQPTSPFRTGKHIKEAFKSLQEGGFHSLVSVKAVQTNPFHVVVRQGESVKPLIDAKIFSFQTQATPDIFCLNGCIYFAKTDYFSQNKSFLGDKSGVYLMSEQDSMDIDTPEDLEIARNIYSRT